MARRPAAAETFQSVVDGIEEQYIASKIWCTLRLIISLTELEAFDEPHCFSVGRAVRRATGAGGEFRAGSVYARRLASDDRSLHFSSRQGRSFRPAAGERAGVHREHAGGGYQ